MGVKNSATTQFFGLIFNWALYGTLSTQVYTYYISFPNDKLVYKAIVYGIFLLENAQTAALTYGVYDSLVSHFGDPVAVESVRLTWFAIPLCSGLISFIAHMVYVYRINRLSKSLLMTFVVLLFILLQLATAIAEVIQAHNSLFFNQFHYTSQVILATWSFSTAACDVIIAALISFCLIKCDPKIQKTTEIITKLIQLSIETGTATAILAILNAVLFIALPKNEDFNIPAFILSKSYSNALLRLLNSRITIEKECNRHQESAGTSVSAVRFASAMSRVDRPNQNWDFPDFESTFQPNRSRKSICIRRETIVFTDSNTKSSHVSPSPLNSTLSE